LAVKAADADVDVDLLWEENTVERLTDSDR
jgi:hypothetical protein